MESAQVKKAEDFVVHGKWGFYPCDYDTYKILKALNTKFENARRRDIQHTRWSNKLPKNRVKWKPIKQEETISCTLAKANKYLGVKIADHKKLDAKVTIKLVVPVGYETPPTPVAEPKRNENFYVKQICKYTKKESLVFTDFGIVQAFTEARFPKEKAEQVKPLSLTKEQIKELVAKLLV